MYIEIKLFEYYSVEILCFATISVGGTMAGSGLHADDVWKHETERHTGPHTQKKKEEI